jgi:hypothetical protein
MKPVVFAALTALLLTNVNAEAATLKAALVTVEEAVSILKTGKASLSATVESKIFRLGTSRHLLLGTMKHNGKDVHVLVSREIGEGMDLVKIHLATPMDASVKQAIDNLPNTYRFHGSIGPVGEKAMADSGMDKLGLEVMEKIAATGQVTLADDGIYATMQKLAEVKEMGISLSSHKSSGKILIDENVIIQRGDELRNTDFRYVESLGDMGPAIAFEIRLGVGNAVTPEQLKRVLRAATETSF